MTSTPSLHIIDDDDEFDWEAAVQAIDAACQNTRNPNFINVNKPSTSRQSTLDKFIGTRAPKPQEEESQFGRDSDHDSVVDREGSSSIKIDHEAAKTWIYPVNVPLRDYQFAMTKTSLFSNTLVTLPTGLGKTLIAAVVMYNYFRWFPEGKIVFTAPSKPLVMQQIEACHNIVGIPQEWTIDLTGETSPIKRVSLWEAKRVFFATPQVLEKDIESGKCLVECIVCLVIDEAHRATGNYSYCVAVRKLLERNVQLRIVALSATPGSKQLAIQQIIDNLQISTLEYRNEGDHDVLPYVHDKKIELVKVAMGQDADDLDSLLSEVIRPYASKLCAFGVLPKRDFQTLSPYDLLNSRAKFREAPPGDLHQMKYGEIEGDFGLLLALVNIRKFLTSYGIRPAFEMLEENRSSLNRLSKNEAFQKLKILMKHSLSGGVITPKLSKMLEVLIDHFKTNDPLNSRVIIFSNFRGIVRDIMNALADIGHIVKATQFVGQSSGKTSKGQSQKIQQAVLKKFREGGYNVIVATSIGEEGLDIMEVDLVICYDANVSPLRMIQRMGRTGRNHEGRVVVLACEGAELKGYLRKQGSCKTLDKHMRNGGRTSFNFHSSPRMIPHIYKPEVQYVELSIKQFVPRGTKVLDDQTIQPPTFEAKLNDAERNLLRKYFQPTENLWRPSLIAFPHFQAFPSRVHNVMHSFRSGMLIDTMQYLQGLSYSRDNKACFDEVEAVSDLSASVEIGEHHDGRMNELQSFYDSGNMNSQREVLDSHVPPLSPTKSEEKHCFTNFRADDPSTHSYLFGSDFVSVDALGRVLLSVPLLPLKDACSKSTSASSGGSQSCFKQDACGVKEDSVVDYETATKQVNYLGATQPVFKGKMVHIEFSDSDSDSQHERSLNVDDKVSETPICSKKFSNGKTSEVVHVEKKAALIFELGNFVADVELSPRLTSLLKSGVVPESPTDNSGTRECKRKCEFLDDDLDSPSKGQTELILNSPVRVKLDKVINDSNAGEVLPSFTNINVPSFAINGNNFPAINNDAFQVGEVVGTPPENPLPNSCSEDWHFTSGDNSGSVNKERKFKRLRKYGDLQKKCALERNESRIDKAELGRSACSNHVTHKHIRGEKKMRDVRVFIEEQAEVSGELSLSEDGDDEQDNNSCDDSFIDDRISLTVGSTPTEDRSRDMMAIYRRSLLSQSPMGRLPIPLMDNTPDSSVSRTQITDSIGSERIKHSPRTPKTGLESECAEWNSEASRLKPEKNPDSVLYNSGTRREDENNIESRKRKFGSYQVGPLPVQNLEHEFLCHSEPQVKELPQPEWMSRNNPTTDEFEDDEFYEGIDLDAVEEQAKRHLECKSQMSVQNRTLNPEPAQNLGEPTFDLGI